MEKFVAVKPYLDFQISFMNSLRATEGSRQKPALRLPDPEFDKAFFSALDEYQSLLMQEALLFDKIYIVETISTLRSRFLDILKEVVEGSGDIFSFVGPYDLIHGWESMDARANPPTEDFIESLAALLNFGASAANKSDEYEKTYAEFAGKFPEIQVSLKNIRDPEAKKSIEPREPKRTPEEQRKRHQELNKILRKLDKSIVENLYPVDDFATRLQALRLEHFENAIATPLLSYTSYLQRFPNSKRHDVAQVVIRDLPLPAINTTWDKIIEYRENPDNKRNLLGLRRWIRKLSAENLSVAECMQELEWLKSEFQAHLRLHEIKANTETLEVIVKAPLEIFQAC